MVKAGRNDGPDYTHRCLEVLCNMRSDRVSPPARPPARPPNPCACGRVGRERLSLPALSPTPRRPPCALSPPAPRPPTANHRRRAMRSEHGSLRIQRDNTEAGRLDRDDHLFSTACAAAEQRGPGTGQAGGGGAAPALLLPHLTGRSRRLGAAHAAEGVGLRGALRRRAGGRLPGRILGPEHMRD